MNQETEVCCDSEYSAANNRSQQDISCLFICIFVWNAFRKGYCFRLLKISFRICCLFFLKFIFFLFKKSGSLTTILKHQQSTVWLGKSFQWSFAQSFARLANGVIWRFNKVKYMKAKELGHFRSHVFCGGEKSTSGKDLCTWKTLYMHTQTKPHKRRGETPKCIIC